MSMFKTWWEREAEGDTSSHVKRQRAAYEAFARAERTGSLDDYDVARSLQDLVEMDWD